MASEWRGLIRIAKIIAAFLAPVIVQFGQALGVGHVRRGTFAGFLADDLRKTFFVDDEDAPDFRAGIVRAGVFEFGATLGAFEGFEAEPVHMVMV